MARCSASNPNLSNPQRLDRSQAVTCDQDHDYTPEQEAYDRGAVDRFVQDTGAKETVKKCTGKNSGHAPNYAVMDYYDGNTVTALWNYAEHYALNDNFYGTNYGPSTPGAINVASGNTYGAICGPSSAVYKNTSCTAAPGAASPASASRRGAGTARSMATPTPTTTCALKPRMAIPPPRPSRWAVTTLATCSTRRRSPGDGLREGSPVRGTFRASRRQMTSPRFARELRTSAGRR